MLCIKCTSPYSVAGSNWNLASIYNPSSSQLHPSFKVYHNSDLTSLLLVKLFPSELLFNQANVEGEMLSKVSVQVHTYEIRESKPVLTDSMTYNYSIKQENVGKRFITQIPLKTELGKRYQLRIVTRDLLRKDFNLKFLDVDKSTPYTEQNFNLINQSGIPYFTNIIPAGGIYKIVYRDTSLRKIYIDYYNHEIPLPKPTFLVDDEITKISNPDSTYEMDYVDNLYLGFSYEGLYYFRFDTIKKYSYVIANYGPGFPKIKTAEELIKPLSYITTSPEYQQLLNAENPKLAVDNFWLGIAKSTGLAKELIRIYYNRVYFANYYFTNHMPGWKTDRGMIYIVYGPPQNMQKTPDTETWLYYTKGSTNNISFTFRYMPESYSADNFVLQRSDSQDWHWREAFDSWRKGQIYLLDK